MCICILKTTTPPPPKVIYVYICVCVCEGVCVCVCVCVRQGRLQREVQHGLSSVTCNHSAVSFQSKPVTLFKQFILTINAQTFCFRQNMCLPWTYIWCTFASLSVTNRKCKHQTKLNNKHKQMPSLNTIWIKWLKWSTKSSLQSHFRHRTVNLQTV